MTARQPHELTKYVSHVDAGPHTATVTPTAIDCKGYEWARFIVNLGVVGASVTVSFAIQESSNSGGSPDTFANIPSGTLSSITASNDDTQHVFDVYLPSRERYMRCTATFDTGSNASSFSVDVHLFHADRDSEVTAPTNHTVITAVSA